MKSWAGGDVPWSRKISGTSPAARSGRRAWGLSSGITSVSFLVRGRKRKRLRPTQGRRRTLRGTTLIALRGERISSYPVTGMGRTAHRGPLGSGVNGRRTGAFTGSPSLRTAPRSWLRLRIVLHSLPHFLRLSILFSRNLRGWRRPLAAGTQKGSTCFAGASFLSCP